MSEFVSFVLECGKGRCRIIPMNTLNCRPQWVPQKHSILNQIKMKRRRRIHSSPPYLITDALPGHIDGRAHDLGLSGRHGSVGNVRHAECRGDGCPGIHGKAAASRCDAAFWMTSNERVAMKRKKEVSRRNVRIRVMAGPTA